MWYLHQVNFSFLETFQTSRTNLGQIVSPFQLLTTIHLITDTSWFHLILDHLLASMQIFVNMYIYTQGQIIWHHQQCESPQISDILHSTDHSHQYKSTPHTVLHLHGGMQILIRTSMFEIEASNTFDNVNAKIQGKEGNLTSSPPRVDIPFQQQHQERLTVIGDIVVIYVTTIYIFVSCVNYMLHVVYQDVIYNWKVHRLIKNSLSYQKAWDPPASLLNLIADAHAFPDSTQI